MAFFEGKAMDERRLELQIGSAVVAKDGDCGCVQQLVIDPHQEKVIGLVVKRDPPSRSAVIVPGWKQPMVTSARLTNY